ncbi:hypothetical protein [Streptomyces sp. NPDC094049]|uniref:hypothetical protein n=1 Tax=Streptomyces sp. NPDC094049 TaxID=3154987 RepID=UPI00332302D7
MSEVYEEFDANADAEEALDALLAQHQSSLSATVGPALDVSAGLHWASPGAAIARSLATNLKDHSAAWQITHNASTWTIKLHPLDFEDASPIWTSSSLNGVMDEILNEAEALQSLARQLGEQSAAGCFPSDTEAVEVTVLRAGSELERIWALLARGGVTKDSATSEFALAVRLLEGQLVSWGSGDRVELFYCEGDAQEAPRQGVAWLQESISVRLGALRRLREQVVRLFEDSEACAFQLS